MKGVSGSASDEIEGPLPAQEKTVAVAAAKDTLSADLDKIKDAIGTSKELTAAHRGKIKQLEPHGAKKRNLILLSLLLAVVALVVWWHSRREALLVVWRLSYPLCFMSSMWTYFLKKTMGVNVVFYNLFGLLLAFFADTVLSPSVGVLVVHCNTHLAACLVGYALAEHRQHEGTEGSAFLVPDMSKEEEEGRLRVLCILLGFFISVFVLALVAGVAWLVWHSADYPMEDLVAVLSFTLSAISLFGILFTAMTQLRGRLISPMGYVFVTIYVLVVFFTYIVIHQTLGEGSAICGFGGLGVTVLFGYCLSVLDTFKQIKRARRVRELSELQSKRS